MASSTANARSASHTMCRHTGSMATDTPQCSARSTTGARLRMKVISASRLWVLASSLYWALGAPVSVPTTPAPKMAAVRRCP